MRRFASVTLSFVLIASSLLAALTWAQAEPAPPPPSTPTSAAEKPEFRTGTAVVLLDVIARDKKGRPVRDLKPEELQVFENDKRCEIRSFRLVETQGTIEPGAAGAVAAPLDAGRPPPAERGAAASARRTTSSRSSSTA